MIPQDTSEVKSAVPRTLRGTGADTLEVVVIPPPRWPEGTPRTVGWYGYTLILDIQPSTFYDKAKMKYHQSDPLFTISVASQLVKLHPRTLMLYEKADLLKPFRTKTGRRRYCQADIDQIKFIHYLTQKKRVNLAGIKVIFDILNLLGKTSPQIKSKLFPDFKA